MGGMGEGEEAGEGVLLLTRNSHHQRHSNVAVEGLEIPQRPEIPRRAPDEAARSVDARALPGVAAFPEGKRGDGSGGRGVRWGSVVGAMAAGGGIGFRR